MLPMSVEADLLKAYPIKYGAPPYRPYESLLVKDYEEKSELLLFVPSKLALHLTRSQQKGKTVKGHKLLSKMQCKPVLRATVVDHFFPAAQHVLRACLQKKQEEVGYGGIVLLFLGTVFYYNNAPERFYVSGLTLGEAGLERELICLDKEFDRRHFIAVYEGDGLAVD